jgi:hypothetical protein
VIDGFTWCSTHSVTGRRRCRHSPARARRVFGADPELRLDHAFSFARTSAIGLACGCQMLVTRWRRTAELLAGGRSTCASFLPRLTYAVRSKPSAAQLRVIVRSSQRLYREY